MGVVSVPLKFLSHLLDFQDEPLTVIDYRAKQCGFLRVDLIPCDSKEREDVDLCVNDPTDLVSFENYNYCVYNLIQKEQNYGIYTHVQIHACEVISHP